MTVGRTARGGAEGRTMEREDRDEYSAGRLTVIECDTTAAVNPAFRDGSANEP